MTTPAGIEHEYGMLITQHAAAAGTQRSMRLIGPARAKLLLFTGRRLDGEQAVAWGLAEVLADDPVQARTMHTLLCILCVGSRMDRCRLAMQRV